MKAVMLYTDEDQHIQEIWNNHLYTIDVLCQSITLSKDGSGIWGQLQQLQEHQLLIMLWSVDALVLFKRQRQLETLEKLINQQKALFGIGGILSALARPCAYEGTIIEETLLSQRPISSLKGQMDQTCLDLARETKSYFQQWEKALKRASMTPLERTLEDKYGPEGDGPQRAGDTITFEGYVDNTFSQLTGTIVYVQEKRGLKEKYAYIVQVEGEAEHRHVWPQEVVEGANT